MLTQSDGTTHHLITKTHYILFKKDAKCLLQRKRYKKSSRAFSRAKRILQFNNQNFNHTNIKHYNKL